MAAQEGGNALDVFFAQAAQKHQAGNIAEAQAMYKSLLKAIPDHADALHLLGVSYCQLNDPERGLTFLKKSVALIPAHADARNSLGNALRALGRYRDALTEYDKALALMPDTEVVHYNRGAALAGLGRHEEAIACYRRALALMPGNPETYNNLGNSLFALCRHDEAIAQYEQALALNPDYAEVLTNYGVTLGALGRHDDALAKHDRALVLKPNFAKALCNRGDTLVAMQREIEAVACYEKILAMQPGNAEAHHHLGVALVALNRIDEAIAHYEEALVSDRNNAEIHNNFGTALLAANRHDKAIQRYDKAIALRPDYALAEWNKSLVLLLQGKFAQGFKLYEKRWPSRTVPALPDHGLPLWLGRENIAEKNLLVQAEQGLGDAIQMLRYLPALLASGATCWLQLPNSLAALAKRSFPDVHIVSVEHCPPEAEMRIPIMSLPLAMRTAGEADIPRNVPYLHADPALVAQWAPQLTTTRMRKIGLNWRGAVTHHSDRSRSMSLEQFAPLLAREDIQFVTLQKDLTAAEQDFLARYDNIITVDRDFENTAAVMMQLDAVISVDSAPAHLAAALGRSTYVLLMANPDWRWLRERRDSPWYPSVSLHRQPTAGDWAVVVQSLAKNEF